MASDYLYEQSEVVRNKVMPAWFTQKWNVASDIIDRAGEEEVIGERDFRIPYDTQVGGRVGIYDNNSGDMGRGTAAKGGYLVGSYYSLRLNFELPFLAIKATQSKKTAQVSAFNKAVKAGMPEFAIYLDKFWHGDGTAVLATATSQETVSAKTVYTMDNVTGIQKLRRGMYVKPYANDLSAALTETPYIEKLDFANRKVYLSATVTSASNDDKLCIEGVSGASPAGPRGLYYWNSTATTGSTGGVDRAVELEIIPSSQASGGTIVHEQGMALLDKMMLRFGEISDDLVGFANVQTRAQIFSDLLSLQNFDISGGNSFKDRLPSGLRSKSFNFCGIPVMVDIHQDFTRLDITSKSAWGKAVLGGKENALKFFEMPGSGQRFFPIAGASGGPAAAVWFGLTSDCDWYQVKPGAQGVITGITPNSTMYGS
jgi:hypothetical protein